MKTTRTVLVLALIASSFIASAQTTKDVKLGNGLTSASITDRISGNRFIDYTVSARAGQNLSVSLSSKNSQTYFNVTSARSQAAMFVGSLSGNKFGRMVADDGKITVRVYLMRAAARRGEMSTFSLRVSLTGKPLAALRSSSDALVPGTRFHASSNVSCKLDAYPKVTDCKAMVVRRGNDGTATVEFRAQKLVRRVLFVKGKAVASDSMDAMTAKRVSDNTVLRFGEAEEFTVPDALLTGG